MGLRHGAPDLFPPPFLPYNAGIPDQPIQEEALFSTRSMFRAPSIAALFTLGLASLVPDAGASDGGHSHHNHAALSVSATLHDSHVYPTVGVDFERYLHEQVGVLALGELVFADVLAQIAGLGLAYHPIAPVKVALLGGMEFADGHSVFLTRGTLEYAIHAGPASISPSVSVDYMDSEFVYVAGAAVGMGF